MTEKIFEMRHIDKLYGSLLANDDVSIHLNQGEILCLDNGKLSFVEKDIAKAAYKLTKKLVKGDSSYITVLYGADVSDEAAEALSQQLGNKYPNMDNNLINGGQPVYYYIISVE